MSALKTLETRSKKKQRTKESSYRPDPPIIKENRDGIWKKKAGWKLGGPSGLGKMAGVDTYGTSRDQYIAEIWEKCQPKYFQAMMDEYCDGRMSKKKMQEQMVDNDLDLSGSEPNPDGYHRKNGGVIGQLIQMDAKTRAEEFKKITKIATDRFFSHNKEKAKLENWGEKREEIEKMFFSEIKKRTYTSGGTADEESDIQRYMKTDWKDVKRGDIDVLNSMKPVYDAFKDYKGDEKWLNYEWSTREFCGWPGKMAAHLDGILIGKGKIGDRLFKFFDVFEAKQRQGKKVINIGGPGKDSERLQCALYCMMLIGRPERLQWLNQSSLFPQEEAKCGSWLLQTPRGAKDKQTLDFLPMDEEQFDRINEIVWNFLRDLNLTQAYQFEKGTQEYLKSISHQERICKYVASPI